MKGRTRLIDFYDQEAVKAERYSSKDFWERRYHTKRLLKMNSIFKCFLPASRSFLDIGCGTGEYLSLSSEYPCNRFGLDLSRTYLERCKDHNADGLVLGDISHLPFKDEAIDCILCSEVLEHISDAKAPIKEIFRVAEKFVIISTPNHGILRTLAALLSKHLLSIIDARVGHVNIMKAKDLRSRLENPEWIITGAMTLQVSPPFLSELRFPRIILPLIELCERCSDRLMRQSGSISIICLRRRVPHAR